MQGHYFARFRSAGRAGCAPAALTPYSWSPAARQTPLRNILTRLALFLALIAPAVASAQARTVLWYETIPASGPATSRLFQPETDTFQLSVGTTSQFTLDVNPNAFLTPDFARVDLGPVSGQAFSLGPAEVAQNYFGFGSLVRPYLNAFVGGLSCSVDSGRFVVLDLGYDVDSISRFAADFEEHCSDGSVTYGEARLNSAVPLTMDKPLDAAVPDAFAFVPRRDVGPSALVTSSSTTIYGIRAASPIDVAGGEYSVNGGPYTAAPGTVLNRDHVTVRAAAPAQFGATSRATLTVGGVSAAFDVTTYTPGIPFTAFSVEQEASTPTGPATRIEGRPPEWNITTTSGSSHVDVNATGPTNTSLIFRMENAGGQPLVAGAYENAAWTGTDVSPQLLISLAGCEPLNGRFVIHEIEGAPSGSVSRLAASLAQWCTSGPPVFAELRINSTMPLASMVAAPVSTPYPFALSAASPVAAGSLVRSNLITIDGVNQAVPISIAGGEYSLNGGAFTSLPGVAHLHDEIQVQLTASRVPGVATSATLSAGGQSATLSVTTYRAGMSLSGLYLQGDFSDAGFVETGLFLAPPNRVAAATRIADGLLVSATSLGRDNLLARLRAPGGAPLNVGTYEGATRVGSATEPVLDVFEVTAGCNRVGRFVVREAVYASDGTPQRFAVDLEQHCEPPTTGLPRSAEFRFNSTVPFSALLGNECTGADPTCAVDLATRQAASGSPVLGGEITFTVTVTNAGRNTAHSVVVTDTLPAGSSFVRSSAACSQSAGTVTCNAGDLANDASASFDIVVRADAFGAMENVANATALEPDATPTTNLSSAQVAIEPPPRAVNISTRGRVGVGDDVLIGGFIIGGATPKTVVVTAIGPALFGAGIPNALANPTLTLVRSSDGAVLATNDDWGTATNAAAIRQSGFAPADVREAAIMMTLPPGAYTAIVSGAGGQTGVGIVAVYEVDHPEVPLVNISTRGNVLTGNDVMIGGFVIQGAGPRTVVVAGIGPSLAGAGIRNALPNPTLMLVRSSDQSVVATNDDWGSAPNAPDIQAAGFAPADARESAIMVTLPPGAYTAVLSDAGGMTGVGIVAVYSVP